MCAWKFLWKVWVECINCHGIFWRQMPHGESFNLYKKFPVILFHIFLSTSLIVLIFCVWCEFSLPEILVVLLLPISHFTVLLVSSCFILISGETWVWSRSWRGITAEWRFWWGGRRGRWTAVEEISVPSACQLSYFLCTSVTNLRLNYMCELRAQFM